MSKTSKKLLIPTFRHCMTKYRTVRMDSFLKNFNTSQKTTTEKSLDSTSNSSNSNNANSKKTPSKAATTKRKRIRKEDAKQEEQNKKLPKLQESVKTTESTIIESAPSVMNTIGLPAGIDTQTLLSSISGQLSSTDKDMIQMLATKMAEEIAAQKLREMLPDVSAAPIAVTTTPSTTSAAPTVNSPASKKSKEEREQEKQKRDEEKHQRELKREEEKRQREEKREKEKRQREQKREEEKQKREEEKQKREEEKQKREEERLKKEEEKRKNIEEKERKQLRIASFFTVKKKTPTNTVHVTTTNSTASNTLDANNTAPEDTKITSDFDATFLPFYLRANVTLCEPNSFSKPPDVLMRIQTNMDTILKAGVNPKNCTNAESAKPQDSNSHESLADYLKARRVKRGYKLPYQTRDAVEAFNAGSANDEKRLVKILQSLPQKYISFSENVRPPYAGTFTKPVTRFPRNNPFYRIPVEEAGFNYDYDSEIEWTQEDEDGEDLDMDDESDDNDDLAMEDDDLDGFVSSDESGAPQRRMMIAGPLTPVTMWNDKSDTANETFAPMAIDILAYCGDMDSIDPFFDYWTVPKKQPQSQPQVQALQSPQQLSIGQLRSSSSSSSNQPQAGLAKKLVATVDMKSFITKIQGTDMNQIMLVETLKREFPQYSKETIRNTIRQIAHRVGEKEPNKVWKINQDVWELHAL